MDDGVRLPGKTNYEFAALADTVAMRFDLPAMKLHDLPHQRKADSQSARRAFEPLLVLNEHLKDICQHGRRYAAALIAHSEDNGLAFHADLQSDRTSGGRISCCIGQEVDDDLLDPGRIAPYRQNFIGHFRTHFGL